ncbi:MAG: hypothetical protein WD875_06260 [Pirellulales bacterium]
MALTESLLIYLLIGFAVAAAVALFEDCPRERIGLRNHRSATAFRVVEATFFWPLFLPILLSRTPETVGDEPRHTATVVQSDDALSRHIAQVDDELVAALASLDGWAEGAIARERVRIDELRAAWRGQAQRIRDMDRVLAATAEEPPADATSDEPTSRAAQSARARRENFARLGQVRDRAATDLATTLSSVRELVSMIHLAKFTGEPASRADELLAQIAAAVEGLSEVAAWSEAPAA